MANNEINHWLQEGIAAAKAGKRERAYTLFMNVLRIDEENETAWLWLSGVVKSNEERRICLENVLTLNPDNRLAQRGLDRLESQTVKESTVQPPAVETEEKVLRREYAPFSPASAILYPDRLTQEVRWQEPVIQQKVTQPEIKAHSSYDDVWSQNVDICAYCAHQVSLDMARCPNCNRSLIHKSFTYPKPSSNMHVYWVLLIGLGQLFMVEAVVNVVLGPNYLAAAGYVLLLLVFWSLAVGVYFRQTWAHFGAVLMLIMVLLGFSLNALVDVDYSGLGLAALDSSVREFVGSFIGGVLSFLAVFEVITAVLALLYGIFMAGPDFERVETRLIAKITKGRHTAADYHDLAQRLSANGFWAAAILHWQRAAAQEPGQVTYQKQLGLAYKRLGFYQRGLDVLQSAHELSTYGPTKDEIVQHIEQIKRKLAANQADTAVSATT